MSDKTVKICSFLLFHSFFVYLDASASGIGRIIQSVSLFLFIILFNLRLKYIFNSINRSILLSLLIYIVSLITSSLLSIDINERYFMRNDFVSVRDNYTHSSFTLGIMYGIVVFVFFSFISYLNKINRTYILIDVFLKICLFYCLISDVLAFIGIPVTNEGYLVGNKFSLSYLHLYLIIFYYFRNKTANLHIRPKYLYLLFAYSIFISLYTECTTALLGNIFMLIIFRYEYFFCRYVLNVKVVLIFLLICAAFPLFITYLIHVPLISYIITDILGEDLTLTGRLYIYELLPEILSNRLLFGFGIGNSNGIMMFLYGKANTQNGIANSVLEIGIIGTFALIFLIYTCLNSVKGLEQKLAVFPIYSIIFTLIAMSMVEITLDIRLVVFLSFVLVRKNINYNKLSYL